MTTFRPIRLLACVLLFSLLLKAGAVTPPVVRSTEYNGAYSNIVHYTVQPWMNTNTALMTIEAWVFCNDLNGFQAFVARHYTTSLWFGLTGNHLRFYRSGGTSADSDGTMVVGRWTHVAVTYDGSTARFFINGTTAGVKALANAGNNSTNGLSLGGQRDVVNASDIAAAGYAFNGNLDEVRLWSVVRSQSAIAANLNSEVRSGTGLLATFGAGGNVNDLVAGLGTTQGIPVRDRWSGFGILPANLCIPWTRNALRVDANIDLLNEYRGAETLVLRSTTSATTPDRVAYLMVCTNATNYHLYVGVPDLPQAGLPQIPVVQIMADVNVTNGTGPALGDWQCGVAQDTLQGGSIYGVNPPFFPNPAWLGWGQSATDWQATTGGSFEFHQSYEFRIHARHLNYFTNAVGLLVRYYDYDAGGDQLVGPGSGVTNRPATYARVDWCGAADTALSFVSIAGSVTNLSGNGGAAGRTVSLYSGSSELGGSLLASISTDAQGKFLFNNVQAPNDRQLTVTYSPPGSIVYLDPAYDITFAPTRPVKTNSPYSVTFPSCSSVCTYGRLNFRYRSLGQVQVTGVSPASVPAAVIVRTSPLKTTAASTITVFGTNFHPGVHVFFKGSGCGLIPPDLCTSDWHEANLVSVAEDGLSLVAEVPTALNGVTAVSRVFQIVVKNLAAGSLWNYGPSVTVTPPSYPQLYGFEFINRDDSPSWQEFEASFGDNIFVDVPFTDVAIPGLRDPYYYAFFLPIYMTWMELAQGSCSGFAATSRLMANGSIPSSTFDRADNGDGVHGVLFPDGYLGLPPCIPTLPGTPCPPKPAAWTGFDLFHPFQPIDVWARIISLQGAQTSAEFLNTWLGQLHRPIAIGPRSGISVGDPNLVLARVRSDARENLIVLGGRAFESLHTVTPYGVLEEQGLMDDLLTPTPRAGFTLIQIYDNNWPQEERFIEVNRTQNTFRYFLFETSSGRVIVEGAGLYYMPLSVYRNPRHALGPIDVAANLANLLRVLHTGTTATTLQDGAGGVAGWSGTNLVNSYEGALPFVPPGALPDAPDRFDRTMFFLPTTNPPTAVNFVSAGSDVVLHYGLGDGDFAYGFRAPNTTASNSVYGILIGLNQALQGMGIRAGAGVQGFSASVSSRDPSRQSRVWLLDAGAGALTPDLHLERDGFKSLKIRNNSAQPLSYRVDLAGYDLALGVFEFSSDALSQPGNSTVVLRPLLGTERGFVRDLDANNDGVPETVENVPARGALRASKESDLLVLRWRPASGNDSLLCASNLTATAWSPVGVKISSEGADWVVRLPISGSNQFYKVLSSASNCFSLAAQPLGAKPNPWTIGGFSVEALNASGTTLAQNTIVNRSGATGLDVVHTVRIQPLEDCQTMHFDLRQTSGYVLLEAVGPLGAVAARQELTGAGAGPQRVTLRVARNRIHHVRVVSPNALCLILNVCCERVQTPAYPPFNSCLSLSNATAGQFSSPYALDSVIVSAAPGPVSLGPVSGLGGNWLKLGGQVELKFTPPNAPCDRVTLRLWDLEGVVTATAYNESGAVVASAGPPAGSATPQELVITGTGIVRVVLASSSDKAFLQEVCCSRATGP